MGIFGKIHYGVKFDKCLSRNKKIPLQWSGIFFVSGRDRLQTIGLLRSAADPVVV